MVLIITYLFYKKITACSASCLRSKCIKTCTWNMIMHRKHNSLTFVFKSFIWGKSLWIGFYINVYATSECHAVLVDIFYEEVMQWWTVLVMAGWEGLNLRSPRADTSIISISIISMMRRMWIAVLAEEWSFVVFFFLPFFCPSHLIQSHQIMKMLDCAEQNNISDIACLGPTRTWEDFRSTTRKRSKAKYFQDT